jgi:hypothetical protein
LPTWLSEWSKIKLSDDKFQLVFEAKIKNEGDQLYKIQLDNGSDIYEDGKHYNYMLEPYIGTYYMKGNPVLMPTVIIDSTEYENIPTMYDFSLTRVPRFRRNNKNAIVFGYEFFSNYDVLIDLEQGAAYIEKM